MACRVDSPLEECINSVTHALGLLASFLALPWLIRFAATRGDGLTVVGVGIFGLTLIGAYGASTIYHAVPRGPLKEFCLRLDYSAVFLLIAGTYTPFALGALRGPWGISLLVVVWSVAIAGIYMKMRIKVHNPVISTLCYLGMGWLAVFVFKPLVSAMGWEGFAWLAAGGLAYSIGTIFLIWGQRTLKFGHCAWHLFVLAGSACHVVAVTMYGL
jgi:hemolysin III